MAGGQQINVGQGTLTNSVSVPLVGQAVTVTAGTIVADNGTGVALAGQSVATAVGTPVATMFVPLRSRKVGGGTAFRALTGQQINVGHGQVSPNITKQLTGQAVAMQQGSVGKTSVKGLAGQAVSVVPGALGVASQQEPTFFGIVPTIQFIAGAPATISLLPNTLNFNPTLHRFQQTGGGSLPSGVTINPVDGFVSDGTTVIDSEPNVVVTIVDTAMADFAARSAGAFWSENWSTYADAAAWHAFWHRGALPGVWTPKNPSMGSVWTNAWEIVTTPGHVLSGKALRAYMGKNPTSPGGDLDNQWAGFPLNGDPFNIPGAFKNKVYIQLSFWTDEYVDYLWRKSDGQLLGTKFIGVDQWNGLSAGNLGETVVDGSLTYPGFLTGYHQTSGSTSWERQQATPGDNNNIAGQGAVNTGSALDATVASYLRRYGPLYRGMYAGGLNQASLLHNQGVPDANAAIGGLAINRGGITVVEIELDHIARRLRVWGAHHGNAPKLLRDTGAGNAYNYTFPGAGAVVPGGCWSGVTLTNLAYQSNEAQNPGRPAAPYTDYSELIVHPNPINFPGNYPLPGV